MGKTLNAFTPDTAQNLQLDAGIVVLGLTDPKIFDGVVTSPAKTVGATSGGVVFTAIPSIRNIFEDLDGSRGNYKDGNVIDTWDIKMSFTMKEITANNLKMSLAAADITPAAASEKYDTLKGRNEIKSSDYLPNLVLITTQNTKTEFIMIEIKNVLNITGLTFTTADKSTGMVDVELQAHFDLATPNEVPFKIYTPKATV